MNFRKMVSKKRLLGTALAMLKIVEKADFNVVFIGLVILGIFCIGFGWHFKREIRKLELATKKEIRELELEAETQQSERKKRKKRKGR